MLRKACTAIGAMIMLMLGPISNAIAAELVFEAPTTAYSLDVRCTGKRPGDKGYGITKSGISALKNPYIAAVNPERIPMRSILYVEGLGFRIAADTGSFAEDYPDRIDLYFAKPYDMLLEHGVKTKKVAIVRWGIRTWTGIDLGKHFDSQELSRKDVKFSQRALGVPESEKISRGSVRTPAEQAGGYRPPSGESYDSVRRRDNELSVRESGPRGPAGASRAGNCEEAVLAKRPRWKRNGECYFDV